ncbi:hypothetical protein [Corallococcus aberystwythensis]|nr:hypothetical protein [Corallococcus aberystwythensis]
MPGISIVAPRLLPGGSEAANGTTRVRCDPMRAPDTTTWPYARLDRVCSWEHLNFSRQFRLDWYPDTFEPGKSPEENLTRLEREAVQPFAPNQYTRLPAPWMGWEWRGLGEGQIIRDRWIVVGTGLLFLQAISVKEDPFPEGDAFLDSLRVTATESR